MRWSGWFRSAPSLVAESLRSVADPLTAWLKPQPAAAPSAVAAALANALLPPVAAKEPPSWLRADQRLSFQRALAAVQRFGGTLLADGVGTGKTYISLAVAATLEPAGPIHVLAPAALLSQWKEAAARTGIPVRLHSHETLSRGRAPRSERGGVIIDESHRFRTPTTRRYETLAPWLVGRRGLLLSATPAVNRLVDVAHQLLLLVRDDALAWAGTPSLLNALRHGAFGELSHLVVTGEDRSRFLPACSSRAIQPVEPPSPWEETFRGINSLELSRQPAVARLIRIALLQALASSPAALADALRRYQSLLLHARDAGSTGTLPTRRAIRAMVGPELEQLVLWPLVAEQSPLPDLALNDLERVRHLERQAREWCVSPDAKILALRSVITDTRPTLVFTTLTATARHIRLHLARTGVAWCTGTTAGLDRSHLPRDRVLDWFRGGTLPTDGMARRPILLIATDVASEGLDLPRVERVVHYDLPWTALRLEQRSGRAVRLGAVQREVEVIRFRPPPAVEAILEKEKILEVKSGLATLLGLDTGNDAPWRLRARVASAWQGVSGREGTAMIEGAQAAVVAGFRIGAGGVAARTLVVARTSDGWTDDAKIIAGLLEPARGIGAVRAPVPAAARSAIRALVPIVRKALRTAHGAGITPGARPPLARRALGRLLALARGSVRARASGQILRVEAGIRFLRRGHTAGELRIAERWATIPERQLLDELDGLPTPPVSLPIDTVELIGMLVITR